MRTENAIKNASVALFSQVLLIVLSFISRSFFIKSLGSEILGINGLFMNLLSILSFAELGIGNAINYEFYKPLHDHEFSKVKSLLNFYRKTYRIIGFIILFIGIVSISYLSYIIKTDLDSSFILVAFIVMLLSSSFSYFGAHIRTLFIASQKGRVVYSTSLILSFLQTIIQICILLLFKNYILYLVIQLLITFLFNIEIFRRASNAFSDVFKATAYPLPKETLRNITKNTISMVAHKTGSIIVSGTDNLLISIYVNIRTVGYYSNYLLFVTTFNTLFGQVYDSLTSSVGDFGNQIDKKKDLIIFRSLNVFNHFSYGIFSSIMIFLVGGFIGLWIGNEYIFENEVMAIIVINLYLYGTRKTSILYINARGLFWNIKWKSIVESIVNLVFSLIFLTLFKMGIFGVLLGTTISTLTTNFWWEPYVVYKDVHEISFVHYLKSLVRPITHNIVSISVLYLLFSNVIYFSYYDLFIRGFVIVLVHSVLWLAFFSGQPEFRFLWEIVVNRVLRVTPMKRK